MTRERPPCRLYGIFAREAPVGVLFRRGPSKWVQLIRWDVESDTFEPGQWFKGRIYERRGDLSPDGSLLVYFASKQQKRDCPVHELTWTAVSRPPYLTALALWWQGDCWSGGGLFNSDAALALNPSCLGNQDGPGSETCPLELSDLELAMGEDDPIEITRLERDGWTMVQDLDATCAEAPSLPDNDALQEFVERVSEEGVDPGEAWKEYMEDPRVTALFEAMGDQQEAWDEFSKGYTTHAPRILTKPLGDGVLEARISIVVFRTRWEYTRIAPDGTRHSLDDVEWADRDPRGRLAVARAGRILVAEPKSGAPEFRELIDLDPHEFTPVEAPGWATQW